jgi:hypothetical protein
MSNVSTIFTKVKSCFGQYENWDSSWHCKGCPIKDECESSKVKENKNECTEN